MSSKRAAKLSAHVTEPPRPTTPTFFPLATPQCRMGEYVVIPAQRSGGVAAMSRFEGTRSELFIHDDAVGVTAVSYGAGLCPANCR